MKVDYNRVRNGMCVKISQEAMKRIDSTTSVGTVHDWWEDFDIRLSIKGCKHFEYIIQEDIVKVHYED